ncbi:MAG: S1C family serine protease [Oscillospiraceae bacterium]|nr:S1C family serine protease [Oscillospiraceae bacterium]
MSIKFENDNEVAKESANTEDSLHPEQEGALCGGSYDNAATQSGDAAQIADSGDVTAQLDDSEGAVAQNDNSAAPPEFTANVTPAAAQPSFAANQSYRHDILYSPGICVDPPQPRSDGKHLSRSPRGRKSFMRAFLKVACLVLVCALFSGAATWLVMDFRFTRGDFTQNNTVVLGNSSSQGTSSNPGYTVLDPDFTGSAQNTPGYILPEDIYDIALTQVVSVITEASGVRAGELFSGSPVSGSGFIVSTDGYILTNYHVVELAFRNDLPITVVLSDESSYEAKIVGFEENSDVAVLKIETGILRLNPALIGNSDNIRVGQRLYAVGNPFGDYVYTMTDGIVSALDRVVTLEGKTISTFQFSAAVNLGNSGGPVYNANGEVIGIVTAKVMRGNVEGIGFAIPINDAIDIAVALIEHGYITGRPLIGVTVQTVSSANADYFDWVVGTYVRHVNSDSAAQKAGIRLGDIITAINDDEVDSLDTLRFALRKYSAGDTATITVWRAGEIIDLTITFDEDIYAGMPEKPPNPTPDSADPFENLP